MVKEMCHWMAEQDSAIRSPPPGCANLGVAQRLCKGPPAHKLSQAPASVSRQVKKYTRLLLLEECAMEDQIRR